MLLLAKKTHFDMGVSINEGTQNGWFTMENPIKMDDLGVPQFQETSISFSFAKIYRCLVCQRALPRPVHLGDRAALDLRWPFWAHSLQFLSCSKRPTPLL